MMKIAANTEKKKVFWLAGDSTMQSYSEEKRPQWGWGECLLKVLEEKFVEMVREEMKQGGVTDLPKTSYIAEIESFHREDSCFEQQKRYVGRYFELDNCAMAGRSTKTFREEGRLKDIEEHIMPEDYLLIQFGHNDSAKEKPERYVALEDFKASLATYAEVAKKHDAIPIFLSSIVLCPSKESLGKEAEEIKELLPQYGKIMEEYAAELNTTYIDMNQLTNQYLQKLTIEEAEAMYLPDHVHLVLAGAQAYAELAAEELKEVLRKR